MSAPEHPDDPRSTAELFAVAEREQRHADDPEWTCDAVPLLHRRATAEVFETALQWCRDEDPVARMVAANVLGQLGAGTPVFKAESVALLIPLLSDGETAVVAAAAVALGHRKEASAAPALVSLVKHPAWRVRDGVVHGLSGCLDDPLAVAGLIELSRDEHDIVRDWATFGLGSQTSLDTAELRAALLDRVVDDDLTTRLEAFAGLVVRQDDRILEPLIRELTGEYRDLTTVEAASTRGLQPFHEYLLPRRALVLEQTPSLLERYEKALLACQLPEDA